MKTLIVIQTGRILFFLVDDVQKLVQLFLQLPGNSRETTQQISSHSEF